MQILSHDVQQLILRRVQTEVGQLSLLIPRKAQSTNAHMRSHLLAQCQVLQDERKVLTTDYDKLSAELAIAMKENRELKEKILKASNDLEAVIKYLEDLDHKLSAHVKKGSHLCWSSRSD